MAERAVSNTRFKLQEAEYFLKQMKDNADDKTHFIFNLIAFVVAGRSVTFVMQKQYKNGEDEPFWRWYVPNVWNALKREEVPNFFHDLRNIVLKEGGNLRQTIFCLYSAHLESSMILLVLQVGGKSRHHSNHRQQQLLITLKLKR
jgi:hypothetical protein